MSTNRIEMLWISVNDFSGYTLIPHGIIIDTYVADISLGALKVDCVILVTININCRFDRRTTRYSNYIRVLQN